MQIALALAIDLAGAIAFEAACGVAKSPLWMIDCFDRYHTASLADTSAPDILLFYEELWKSSHCILLPQLSLPI